tara:strand:+ start:354 stop:548 length:195 start_codon:yes stop_codon:yes gene_type:complete
MMNLTNSAKNHFLNFFNILFAEHKDPQKDLINYCKAEYGRDWRWAYREYLANNEFPKSFIKRTI